MHSNSLTRVLKFLVGVIAITLLAITASAQTFVSPPTGSFSLTGCRNTGNITLPSSNNAEGAGFVCPDAAYTSGNLGKGWNELDLVPFRLVTSTKSSDAPGAYNLIIAGEYQDKGVTGWDVIDSDNAIANGDLAGPTKNPTSDSSCSAIWTAQSTAGPGIGGADSSIYRILQITQTPGTTCVWDYYMRLALGSHLYSGSSLHGFKFNSVNFTTGSQDIPLPVNQILPQSLAKTMTATQNYTIPWSITKTANPASLTLADTCNPSSPLSQPVTVTITWTKLNPVANGGVSIQTVVSATNPSARSIIVNVSDVIYGGSDQSNPLNTYPSTGTMSTTVPANSTVTVLTHDFTDTSGAYTTYNDIATATYTDSVTGFPVPGDTTASASATVQAGTTMNATATIADEETITGNNLEFTVNSTTPAQPYGTFSSCSVGTATTACNWSVSGVSGSGSVSFNKSVSITPKTVSSGDLVDQATLTGSDGFLTTSNKVDISISANAFVTLNLTKNVTGLATGSQLFQFHVFGTTGSNAMDVGDPSLTFTAGETQQSLTPALTGLLPDTYSVTEDPVSGWMTDPGQTVDLNLPNCSGTATLNNTQDGAITIVKNTVGGDGTFDFTSNFGVSAITTINGTNSQTVTNLTPGSSYSISESPMTGWVPGAWSCSNGTSSAITVVAGQTTTCTITNTAQGGIQIIKKTVGGDGTFSFTSNFGVSSIATSGGTGSQTVTNLNAGSSYSISESALAGWDEGTFSCSNGTASAITVVAGQTTTCTITNTKQGAIQIVKNTVGGDGTFSFTSDFGVSSITTSNGTGSQTVTNLTSTPTTPYSITETAQTGWDEGTFSCTNGTPSNITVVAGQTTTCTITNTKQGAIQIVKNTVGGDGTFNFTSDFGVSSIMTASGTGSQTVNNLTSTPTTPYSITETAQTGWDEGTFSCTHGTPSSITVIAGQTTICTITNTKQGAIKIVKNTVGGDGTFGFTSDFGVSSIVTSNSTGSQTVNNLTSTPTTPYSITETAQTGWDEGTFSCSNGTPSNITVVAGQITTCTITNTKQGGIKIVKNTVGGDGTFGFTSDFGVSSITTSSGTGSQTVNNLTSTPTTPYSITETAQTGWDEGTFSCNNGTPSNITVVAGQITTCTITNTKQGGIKIVKNTVGGDGTFSFTSDFGVSSITTSNATGSQTVNNLTSTPTTPYSITETAQTGWNEGTFTCSNGTPSNITVVAGQITTCTITNTAQGAIKIVKTAVGGDGTFGYTSNFGVSSLTTSGGTASQTVSNLTPGSNYSISETAQTGWQEGSFSCSNGTASAITVVAGATTTCTITNTKQGSITIVKKTVGGDATFPYTSTALGSFSLVTSGGTASTTFSNLNAGPYSVAEGAEPTTQWVFTSLSCTAGGAQSGTTTTANITLPAGGAVTCTYTNTLQAKAKVVKTYNGGAIPAGQSYVFQLRSGASATAAGTVLETQTASSTNSTLSFTTLLVPGQTYQMCEQMQPGWMTTLGPPLYSVFNPSGDNSVVCTNFTPTAGQTVTFNINNQPPPGGMALTIGYWKNWSSCTGGGQLPSLDKALYTAQTMTPPGISIGTAALYPSTSATKNPFCAEAVDILNKATIKGSKEASNPFYNMAAQLLGAELNVAAGAGLNACVAQDITSAQALLVAVGFNDSTVPKGTTTQQNDANYFQTQLNNYNSNQPVTCTVTYP